MLRFFLWDLIVTYIETPQIEMTATTEMLFYLAVGIIVFCILGIIFLIDWVYNKFH